MPRVDGPGSSEVPEEHEAWRAVVWDEKNLRAKLRNVQGLPAFQVTSGLAGSQEAAMRIARWCAKLILEGGSKEEATQLRARLTEEARQAPRSEKRPGAPLAERAQQQREKKKEKKIKKEKKEKAAPLISDDHLAPFEDAEDDMVLARQAPVAAPGASSAPAAPEPAAAVAPPGAAEAPRGTPGSSAASGAVSTEEDDELPLAPPPAQRSREDAPPGHRAWTAMKLGNAG
ncbi:unnamed protein product, partial [Prorocentrum cordatum]